ncbi:MAG: hypothetical protein KGM47_12370, partial [Acidobacteriota bacterium]|nr:hypothetical protein [Acidobacteriota bacterium]
QMVGMEEGAYRIVSDPETHQERVVSPMGRVFYGKQHGGGEPASAPAVMPLNEFQQRVSKALSRPIVIPSGTAIPLVVRSVSTAGVARILVEARTTSDVFPDSRVVIPAGSVVDGWGREVSGRWTLYWTAISIRGRQARISANNNAGSRRNLQGEPFTAITR